MTDDLNIADEIVPETWHEAEYASAPWEPVPDFGLGVQSPRYYKDPQGTVWLQCFASLVVPEGQQWFNYAGFFYPIIVLPEEYRPDRWVGPLPGISTDMLGGVTAEVFFVMTNGGVYAPNLSAGEYDKFAISCSFRAAD
jgi:hypothetical protein